MEHVCFIKRRAHDKFVPYMVKGENRFLVGTLRSFLDYEIAHCLQAEIKPALLMKIPMEVFVHDLERDTANSSLVKMFGWNFPEACRLVEQEGFVYGLTIHPHFEVKPFSVRRAAEDDDYALHFVEQIFSLRGGKIVFEEYDSEKHVAGYRYLG